MFRKSLNRAVLHIRVETVTPLLIRAGDAGLDPTAADLTPVRTRHGQHGLTAYIPGSSLKGVLRATTEAGVRGQRFGTGTGAVDGACDPLARENSCSGSITPRKRDARTDEIHRWHCLACRLFGSTAMKGRASVRDLLPWAPGVDTGEHAPDGVNHTRANQLELRQGVAIDRIVGSVRQGPFDQELVPAGVSFWGEIALENYQVWQLGLLAQAFDELNLGMAQLGSSKSRGLGAARITVESIVHEQVADRPDTTPGAENTQPRPCGVGSLLPQRECQNYGLLAEAPLPVVEGTRRGLAMRFEVPAAEVASWFEAGRTALGSLAP